MKTELKNFWQSSHVIALNKGAVLAKKWWFFAENDDIRKIKKDLVLTGILSETKYECVLAY